ncbi:T9SS type A sorting domain-containing protein [bacterium]|nr:T9SS type A sorting domain-containing protein [bacterium]
MKKSITILLFSILSIAVSAQTNVKLKLNHLLGQNSFAFNTESQNNIGIKFNVTRLQYYISKVSIVHDGGTVTDASGVYALVNASQNTEVDLGNFDITTVEAIQFSVGVNTPENNDDPTKWPSTHPLAPKSPSMHWGWAAGYRFVAMEGKAGDALNTTFQIHALGNKNYHQIRIPTDAQDLDGDLIIELNADYARAIEGIDVSASVVTHGDYDEAADLLKNFRDYVFTSLDGAGNNLASLRTEKLSNVSAYPNPSHDGKFLIGSKSSAIVFDSYNIYASNGELISSETLAAVAPNTSIEIDQTGLYFIELIHRGAVISRTKLIVIE